MQKGITRERIIEEAEKMISEKGFSAFSMHVIAQRLGVKTASLYSHVSGKEDVLNAASIDILNTYRDEQLLAIAGKERGRAVRALAEACRSYAVHHSECYEMIMHAQTGDHPEIAKAASVIIDPIMSVLDGYQLDENQKVDCERVFRAVINGFIMQERHGYFSHLSRSAEDSFSFAVEFLIHGFEEAEHAE
jgi:AcrR family transcriptional regulator